MERRDSLAYAQERGLSQRRACRLLGVARASARYQAKPDQDELLAQALVQIRQQYPRFGILRAHALLRGRGQSINHKRVWRVWRKHGFQVPQRPTPNKALEAQGQDGQEHSLPGGVSEPRLDLRLSGGCAGLGRQDTLLEHPGRVHARVAVCDRRRVPNEPGSDRRFDAAVRRTGHPWLCQE